MFQFSQKKYSVSTLHIVFLLKSSLSTPKKINFNYFNIVIKNSPSCLALEAHCVNPPLSLVSRWGDMVTPCYWSTEFLHVETSVSGS